MTRTLCVALSMSALVVVACAHVDDDDPEFTSVGTVSDAAAASTPHDAGSTPPVYYPTTPTPSPMPRPTPTPTPAPPSRVPSQNIDPAVLLQGAVPKPGGLPGVLLAGGDLSGAIPKPGGLPGIILTLAGQDAGSPDAASDAGAP